MATRRERISIRYNYIEIEDWNENWKVEVSKFTRLRGKASAASNGAYLNGRHGDADVQITIGILFENVHTHGALHILRRILKREFRIEQELKSEKCTNLTSGDKDGSDDIGSMSVETTDSSGHGAANKILGNVELHQCIHRRL